MPVQNTAYWESKKKKKSKPKQLKNNFIATFSRLYLWGLAHSDMDSQAWIQMKCIKEGSQNWCWQIMEVLWVTPSSADTSRQHSKMLCCWQSCADTDTNCFSCGKPVILLFNRNADHFLSFVTGNQQIVFTNSPQSPSILWCPRLKATAGTCHLYKCWKQLKSQVQKTWTEL